MTIFFFLSMPCIIFLVAACVFIKNGILKLFLPVKGVFIKPGQIVVTDILYFFKSLYSASPKTLIQLLVAEYDGADGIPLKLAIEEIRHI